MTEFDKYSDDFEELINAVYQAYLGKSPVVHRRDLAGLVKEVKELARRPGNSLDLSRDEIRQELACMWVSFIRSYRRSGPELHIRQYLIRRSIWGLRDWIRKESRVLRRAPTSPPREAPAFQLNFSFLLEGETWPPLAPLNAYQRYLIYLKFVEDKDILRIAQHLHKDRHVVSRQLSDTLRLIRRIANEEAHTS